MTDITTVLSEYIDMPNGWAVVSTDILREALEEINKLRNILYAVEAKTFMA